MHVVLPTQRCVALGFAGNARRGDRTGGLSRLLAGPARLRAPRKQHAMRPALLALAVASTVACRPATRSTLAPRVATRTLAVEVVAARPTPTAVAVMPAVVAVRPTEELRGCDAQTGAGCPAPPTVRCPASSRVAAGASTTLRAEATGQRVRVRWSVARAPREHGFRFAPRFSSGDSDRIVAEGEEVPFTAVIVGEYALRVRAIDAFGRAAECESTVAMVSHGLRVELSWDTDGTDVDLHLISTRAPRWFDAADCYFAARQPDVSLADPSRRRWLDTDDVDGHGPENIRVDAPDPEQTYRIGVHYYSSHGHRQRTTPTVLVYCGEVLRGRFSRPLRGDHDSQQNDFWQVASVRFSNAQECAIDEEGTVTTADAISARPDARPGP